MRKWIAVGVAVVVVAGVAVWASAGPGRVDLPSIPPDRLVASAAAALARDPTISGTLEEHLNLGLPDLGDTSTIGVDAGLGLLLGDHTLRLWRSPFGARVSLVESTSERGLYLGRTGAWAWDFATLTATRLAPEGVRTGLFPLDLLIDERSFRGLLDGLEPTTDVFVDGGGRVAGREVYRLALEPKPDVDTLIGRLEFDVDAQTRIPLAVKLAPRGSTTAAVSLGFTSVSYRDIDPELFDFQPPAGVRVLDSPGAEFNPLALLGVAFAGGEAGDVRTRSFGRSWGSVVAIRMDQRITLPDELTQFIPLSTPLLSTRFAGTAHGLWLLIGAVPQKVLEGIDRREFPG
jgi:hypothetical protein